MSLRLPSGVHSLRVPSVVLDCSSSPYGHVHNSSYTHLLEISEDASVEEVEDSHPAKFQVKLASGRVPTARTPKCVLPKCSLWARSDLGFGKTLCGTFVFAC